MKSKEESLDRLDAREPPLRTEATLGSLSRPGRYRVGVGENRKP